MGSQAAEWAGGRERAERNLLKGCKRAAGGAQKLGSVEMVKVGAFALVPPPPPGELETLPVCWPGEGAL